MFALFTYPAAAADTLRVLRLGDHQLNHPHRDVAGESSMLEQFAAEHDLALEWVEAVQPQQLLDLMRTGRGDILIADLSPAALESTDLLRGPSMGLHDYAVYGRHDLEISNPLEFTGLRIAVSLASPVWPYLHRLQSKQGDFELVVLPPHRDREWILSHAGSEQYDAAVVAVAQHENLAREFVRLKRLFDVAASEQSTWYFAATNARLRREVSSYLRRYHASITAPVVDFSDMTGIRERHVIRVITTLDPQNYFLHRGRPAGFEYEWVKRFAEEHGLSTEIIVAESPTQAISWLRAGVGDLISTRVAAQLVRADPGLSQTRTYFHADSVLVSGPQQWPHDERPMRVAMLSNTIEQRQLNNLERLLGRFEPVLLSPTTPTIYLRSLLQYNGVDAALVDASAVPMLVDEENGLVAGRSLANGYPYAWTIPSSSTQLLNAVNRFFSANFRGETYNVLVRRYFENDRIRTYLGEGNLSPYDDLVRATAERYDFDWRLIVAQIYQESRFDPAAVSRTGAQGLMQLLPTTANELGISNPFDPGAGIEGGVQYLDQLRQRFDQQISPAERTWFALAAYNIGFKRIAQARAEAASRGLNPNQWFGQVEKVVKDLGGRTRACYCGQAVVYVRGIRSLYDTYNRMHRALSALPQRVATPPAS